MFSLKGKKAVITGAATGLGQSIAVELARAGAEVGISDKTEADLNESAELIRKTGCTPYLFSMDVDKLDQIEKGIKAADEHLGGVDILVNNAGINRPEDALNVSPENWDAHYNTNIKGGFFVAREAAKIMIPQKYGRIIFISSQSGLIGIPGQAVYCSTKGAIIQATRTLAVEWAKHGITVNSVAPTFVETNLTRKRLQNPEFRNFVLGKSPCGKLAKPIHVSSAVLFLASDEAEMVNGHTLCVDGGWTVW